MNGHAKLWRSWSISIEEYIEEYRGVQSWLLFCGQSLSLMRPSLVPVVIYSVKMEQWKKMKKQRLAWYMSPLCWTISVYRKTNKKRKQQTVGSCLSTYCAVSGACGRKPEYLEQPTQPANPTRNTLGQNQNPMLSWMSQLLSTTATQWKHNSMVWVKEMVISPRLHKYIF